MSNREKIITKQEEIICWVLCEFGIDPKELYKQRYAIDEATEKLMQLIEPEEYTGDIGWITQEEIDDDFFGQMKGAQDAD